MANYIDNIVKRKLTLSMKILITTAFCVILAGCESMALKKGGLYLDKNTCVGMDDLGVAKVNNKF